MSGTDALHDYDVETDPPAIEPVEHRIRLDFMAGGPIRRDQLLEKYNSWKGDPENADPWKQSGKEKPVGLKYAEESCRRTFNEEERYYEFFEDDRALSEAPAFLAHRLRQCQSATDPEEALHSERKRRANWYRKLIPWLNLYQVLKESSYGTLFGSSAGPQPNAEALTRQNTLVGMVVLGDDDQTPSKYARFHSLPAKYVIREADLSCSESSAAAPPSEFGIELPAPLLVGEYTTGGRYPFIPWSDGLVCSCPYKHDQPWRVLCKHELLAAVVAGDRNSIFLPVTKGLDVPHRVRRFVSPDISNKHGKWKTL
jgi:hypothetical protein